MSSRPLMEHISVDPSVQDPSVTKDIKSMFQLLNIIEERRERRLEDVPSPEDRLPPPLQIMAGYQDGKVDSWDLEMEIKEGGLKKMGLLVPRKGNAKKFLDQTLRKKAAETSDRAKSKSIYDRVDIMRVYSQLEREAFQEMRLDDVLNALLRNCGVRYETPGLDTAAIGWDKLTNKFTLHINRPFMVYMTVMNLMNGYPKSTMSSLLETLKTVPAQKRSRSLISATLTYVLKHEMSHIYFQHVGKHMGLYSEFTGQEVNHYGDILINLTLTKKMAGKVDRALVPNIGLGRDRVADGHHPNARAAVEKFLAQASPIFPMHEDVHTLPEKFRAEPAKIVLILSPSAFVEVGTFTNVLLKFYRSAVNCFEVDKPPKVTEVESDDPYKPPTKVSTPVRVGQVVEIKETGEWGVVVRTGAPQPDPDSEGNFLQDVSVVPKSQLPPQWQDAMDSAVEAAGEAP